MERHKPIDVPEAHRIAGDIITLLNGLTIGQARWVLQEAKAMLYSTHRVDISGNDFTAAVEECRDASFE